MLGYLPMLVESMFDLLGHRPDKLFQNEGALKGIWNYLCSLHLHLGMDESDRLGIRKI